MSALALHPLALVGAILVLLSVPADVVSWFLAPDYDPLRNTISDLAVGPSSWLSDLGLWSFGLGCMTVAVAVGCMTERETARDLAALGLFGTGYASALIAPLREYAGETNPGADIHEWCVYAIGVLLPFSTFAGAALGAFAGPWLRRAGASIGAAWLVAAPVFLLGAFGYDGAVERFMALLMIGWALALVSLVREAPAHRYGPARGPVGGRLMRI